MKKMRTKDIILEREKKNKQYSTYGRLLQQRKFWW